MPFMKINYMSSVWHVCYNVNVPSSDRDGVCTGVSRLGRDHICIVIMHARV